ncbi:ABC transporter substrate-binding protein [Gorillibacterium massiliense]|uniref:ABC transporter substrate-binding protein n=1 Tax=Gorillibacterium massiliense TaxID=1280390 RepID=UPI0005954A5F|nr:extracellular solute-binding protein [Gorillibacterium massiliense]
MKKTVALMLLACLLVLSACGSSKNAGNNAPKGEAKEITIWAWDPAFNIAALNKAKEAYAKINPDVKVNIVEYAQNDIVQKLNTGFNSGTTKGLPNIVLIEDYRSQGFLQAYPDSFYDLSNSIKASDFAEYKLGATSLNGKQYGVPFDSGVTGLYIRTDYLQQAGYTLDDVKNIDWDKFIEIGKKVHEKTGKSIFSMDPNDLGLVRMIAQSAGTWYVKEDGKTPFIVGNEPLKEGFRIYKELMTSNAIAVNTDWSQMVASINKGDVMASATGNWFTASIKAEASQSGKWAVAPFPTLKKVANSVHASNLGGSSWYVLNVDGAATAADFMAKTFGSDVNLYQDLVTSIGAIGTYIPAASGDAYKKSDDFFGGQAIVTDFANWTKDIPRVNYGLSTYAIEDILVVEMQNYLNGKDLDQALADAQKQAETQVK